MIFALILFDAGLIVSIGNFDVVEYQRHKLKISYMWRGVAKTLLEVGAKMPMELYSTKK